MGPAHGAAESVGGGQQQAAGDGGHAEADRKGEPGACCFAVAW
jgi:hypothetical protein